MSSKIGDVIVLSIFIFCIWLGVSTLDDIKDTARRRASCVMVEPKEMVGGYIDWIGKHIIKYKGVYTYPERGGECVFDQVVTESMYERLMSND